MSLRSQDYRRPGVREQELEVLYNRLKSFMVQAAGGQEVPEASWKTNVMETETSHFSMLTSAEWATTACIPSLLSFPFPNFSLEGVWW